MRILFDQAVHDMRNKGNDALLQVAIRRFSSYWPDASIDVLTVAPNLARLLFPGIQPVNPSDLNRIRGRFDWLYQLIPRPVLWLLLELREAIWHWWKMLGPRAQLQSGSSLSSPTWHDRGIPSYHSKSTVSCDADYQATIFGAIPNYDVIVFSGGGYLSNVGPGALGRVFDRIEVASEHKIPMFMVGQGIDSMSHAEILARARAVLPKVNLICYRNRRLGKPLLDSLGIPDEKTVMTGDDAVELAYTARRAMLGTYIGVSLRVADYTQISIQQMDKVRSVLHQAAKKRNAKLLSVPISSTPHESDSTYLEHILKGYGRITRSWRKLESPVDTIRRVGQCRLMITGTYHGAIFALAQGIPVVAFARTSYYFDKLAELADEFGSGVRVLHLEDQDFSDRLTHAIDDAWASAEQIRPLLLQAAARQIEMGNAAYKQIRDIVESKKDQSS